MADNKADLKAKRVKRALSDLLVDWDVNPRVKNDSLIEEYTESVEGYIEDYVPEVDGKDFATYLERCWDQATEITSDNTVVKGCHSVLAFINAFSHGEEPEKRYLKLHGDKKISKENYIRLQETGLDLKIWTKIHPVSGKDEAKYLSAQSNRHGRQLEKGEFGRAILFILEQTNKTKENEDPNLKPFLSEHKIAAIVGCSRPRVWQVRQEYLGKAVKSETLQEKIEKTTNEIAERKEKLRQKGIDPDEKVVVPDISDEDLGKVSESVNVTPEEKQAAADYKKDFPDTDVDPDDYEEVDQVEKTPKKSTLVAKYKRELLELWNDLFKTAMEVDHNHYYDSLMVVKSIFKKNIEDQLRKIENDWKAGHTDRGMFDMLSRFQQVIEDSITSLEDLVQQMDEID